MLRPSTRARLILSVVEGEARAARDEEAQHEDLTLSLSKGGAKLKRYATVRSLGNLSTTVVPLPSVLAISSVPPCISVNDLAR